MSSFLENLSDFELSESLKASDADAFEVFYHRYYEKIFSFLWRRIREHENAKDLTQETFARIWKSRKALDSNYSIKAYTYRIANNLAVDHLRKKALETGYVNESQTNEISVLQDEQFDLREKILSSVEELPEHLRLVFTLNRFEGLKYSEISEALDLSVRGVEARMSKALKILREKLQPYLTAIFFLNFFPS